MKPEDWTFAHTTDALKRAYLDKFDAQDADFERDLKAFGIRRSGKCLFDSIGLGLFVLAKA